jgi:hypothetical protein
VSCLEFVCVAMWSFVFASVDPAPLLRFLLGLAVSVGVVCVGLALSL